MYQCDKCGTELGRKERFIDKIFNFCYDCNEEKNNVIWDWSIGFDDVWKMKNGIGTDSCLKCGKEFNNGCFEYETIVFSDINKPRICKKCNLQRLNEIKEWIEFGD